MSFFNKGSQANRRGKTKIKSVPWRDNRNKIIIFLMHFDADFEDFSQLT